MSVPITDPINHPADYIDRARCMLGFVSLMVGGYNGELELSGRDRDGFAHIMEHIQHHLDQALTRL